MDNSHFADKDSRVTIGMRIDCIQMPMDSSFKTDQNHKRIVRSQRKSRTWKGRHALIRRVLTVLSLSTIFFNRIRPESGVLKLTKS